jgi:hypothetical protein
MKRHEAVERVSELASGSHGLVTRANLVAAGLRGDDVDGLTELGVLDQLMRGVFRVAGAPRTWRQSLLAAVLAGGPGAAATCPSAGALWGVPGYAERAIEVTRPRGGSVRSAQLLGHRLHTSTWLPPPHVTIVDAIPVTTPARTAFDLAGVRIPGRVRGDAREARLLVHRRRYERALDNGLAMGLWSIAAIDLVLAELGRRGRAGTTLVRELLDVRSADYVPPASELEALFIELVEGAGLPMPTRECNVGSATDWVGRVEFVYPDANLLVELDSRRYHESKLDRVSDAKRDVALEAAGWKVLRITWELLRDEPAAVVEAIRVVLSSRAAA